MVVFPALSRPRIKIRTSFDPKRLANTRENIKPIREREMRGGKAEREMCCTGDYCVILV